MPKTITSPVDRFPGTIVLHDQLTLAQCIEVEATFGDPNLTQDGKRAYISPRDMDSLKAVLACSVEWHIDGQVEHPTLETFVATPRVATHKLIEWAFREVRQIYFGELQVPNE